MNDLELIRKILLDERIDENFSTEKDLVSHHGLGARLYRLLAEHHPRKSEFLPSLLHNVQRRSLYAPVVETLLEQFYSANLSPIWLKGMIFADRYYSHPEDRPFSDLDLLFHPEEKYQVQEILQKSYLRIPQKRFSANQHKEDWIKKNHPDVKVELHFGLGKDFPFPIKRVKDRNHWVLEQETEFLYLLWHGFVQHRMQKLVWFLDLVMMAKSLDYSKVRKMSEEQKVEPALLMYLNWQDWLKGIGEAEPYLKRVILAENENPLRAAQIRAKINGGWWNVLQYAVKRKFSTDEF